MRRLIAVVLIAAVALQLTGCEAVQRKFTRKKKREPLRPRFYRAGESETRPHLELYIMHYAYWKSWHGEMTIGSTDNAKRNIMACDEMVSHLDDMKKHLLEEKAEELDKYITRVKEITDEMKRGNFSVMRLGYLKQELSKTGARIERKFYYKKVKEYIKPD
ncbi:MAG: hypothetical protein ISS34_03835 [Candidatus Omnitrophica bacterium]|nr:hypothetical protein [Candidatus Omnitrophota bacterium]